MATTIKELTARSSKLEEYEALVQMSLAAGDQTFLATLLNEKLIKWFNSRMAEDHSTDIHDALVNAQADAAIQYGKLTEANKVIASRDEMIKVLQRDINFYKGQSDRQDVEMMGLHDRIEQQDAREERLLGQIDNLQAEVAALKAKAYDLAVAAGRI